MIEAKNSNLVFLIKVYFLKQSQNLNSEFETARAHIHQTLLSNFSLRVQFLNGKVSCFQHCFEFLLFQPFNLLSVFIEKFHVWSGIKSLWFSFHHFTMSKFINIH